MIIKRAVVWLSWQNSCFHLQRSAIRIQLLEKNVFLYTVNCIEKKKRESGNGPFKYDGNETYLKCFRQIKQHKKRAKYCTKDDGIFISVTRLGDFLKFLVKSFDTKVAQIYSDFWAILKNIPFQVNTDWQHSGLLLFQHLVTLISILEIFKN